MINTKLAEYLTKLDKELSLRKVFLGEHEIAEEIEQILRIEGNNIELSEEDNAEKMAFEFSTEYLRINPGWGTYFGPKYIGPDREGQVVEYPSIQKVYENTLSYWEKRAGETQNPILAARYSDLVVELSQKIIKRNADYSLFLLAIDSYIAICKQVLAEPLYRQSKIKRALGLALKIKDRERILRVKDAILALEQEIAEDNKAGLWGFAFKWLVVDFGGEKCVSSAEKAFLLNELESRIIRVKSIPWLVGHAVSLLAEYYANEKDEKNLIRVIGILEESHKGNITENANALLQVHAYEQIHEIYQKYTKFPEAKEAVRRISREIGNLKLDWKKSLQKISITADIKKEEIDKLLSVIFGATKQNSLETILANIAINFLPQHEHITEQLCETSSKHPLNYLFTTQIISDDGIPVAKLQPLTDDYESHFQRFALQTVQFGFFYLAVTTDELKKRISKDEVTAYLIKTDIFKNENKDYLTRAIHAYWDNDYLVASHLFIPIIETFIRELIRECGGNTLVPNDVNGYDRVPLTWLLKKQGDIIVNVFTRMGKDMLFYLRLVMTEKLGMNLRNNFAHGLGKKAFFSREASDRLFHIMLCLSLVKSKE